MRQRFCWAILFAISAHILVAQDQSALAGRVVDQAGAAVVAATVTATNTDTGTPYPAKTDQAGVFSIPILPPGPYRVKWEAAGFKTMAREGLVLETAQSLELNVQMTPGSPNEVVSVSGTVALDTTSGMGQLVDKERVDNMAVESRKAASMTKLSSDVVFKQESGIENTPSFTVAGGRSQDQNWKLDGGSGQDNALGNPQNMLNPPSESLQEFKVETNAFSAEYGRAAGGMIVMTTKGGTDHFHGSVYEYLRNDATDARTFFAPKLAELRWNTFGASMGGPIVRKKTFYFFNWESGRKVTGNTFVATMPTTAEINGSFAGIKGLTITNPATGQPFPNNVIPASQMDRVGKEIADLYPTPNQTYNPSLPDSNNYIANANTNLRQDSFTFRLDQNLTDKDKVTIRWTYIYTMQNILPYFPTSEAFADPQAELHGTQMYNGAFTYTHTFGPSLVNDLKFGYSNHAALTMYSQINSGENAKLGITGSVAPNDFPLITVAGYTSQGSGKQFRDRGPSLTLNPSDSLTWTHGKHSVKFGGEWRYSYNVDRYQQQPGGEFDFSAIGTNNAVASLLLGQVYSGDVITSPELAGRIDIYGSYVQDKYQISQRLTLNIGLRWETEGPRWDKDNVQSGFNSTAINPVSNTPGIIVFDGVNGVSKYSNAWDYKNFGPRFGFAYRMGNTWAIRGGFGIFYDGEYGTNSTSRILTTGFGTNASFNSPDNGVTPAFLFAGGMPAAAPITYTPGYGAVPVGGKPNTSPDFVAQDHKFGYSEQWNIGFQHDISRNLSFEASYVGNMGHRLAGQQIDINQIPVTCDATGCHGPAKQSQTLRPFPQFSHVYEEAPSFGASTYNAMKLKIERKFKGGLTFLANYTWSKFLDNIAGGDDMNGVSTDYESIYLRKLDKSYSGSDVPQQLVANAVYQLPVGKGKHFNMGSKLGNTLFGGWGLTGTMTLHSGVPYGVTDLTNTANSYSTSQRPNILCNPAISNFASTGAMLSEYFNTSCFQAPPSGYFGDAARNVGFGPGFGNLDLSLDKQWSLSEHYNLQFRTDSYNVTNHPNFGTPVTTLGSGNFGTINSIAVGSVARELQFSLKLKF